MFLILVAAVDFSQLTYRRLLYLYHFALLGSLWDHLRHPNSAAMDIHWKKVMEFSIDLNSVMIVADQRYTYDIPCHNCLFLCHRVVLMAVAGVLVDTVGYGTHEEAFDTFHHCNYVHMDNVLLRREDPTVAVVVVDQNGDSGVIAVVVAYADNDDDHSYPHRTFCQ